MPFVSVTIFTHFMKMGLSLTLILFILAPVTNQMAGEMCEQNVKITWALLPSIPKSPTTQPSITITPSFHNIFDTLTATKVSMF